MLRKRKSDVLRANINKLAAAIQSDKDKAKSELWIPFAGPIGLLPAKDSLHFATVFGVDFYMHKFGAELTGDIVSPAWASIPVTRGDQAFFEVVKAPDVMYLWKRDGGNGSMSANKLPVQNLCVSWERPKDTPDTDTPVVEITADSCIDFDVMVCI